MFGSFNSEKATSILTTVSGWGASIGAFGTAATSFATYAIPTLLPAMVATAAAPAVLPFAVGTAALTTAYGMGNWLMSKGDGSSGTNGETKQSFIPDSKIDLTLGSKDVFGKGL